MTTHLAAQGSSRLRGRIGAARRWHGSNATAELDRALAVALAAEAVARELADVELNAADADFLHHRIDDLARA